ncbi:hypothetical protein FOCC_FOCC016692, partial [Frankliniella occidentalis]
MYCVLMWEFPACPGSRMSSSSKMCRLLSEHIWLRPKVRSIGKQERDCLSMGTVDGILTVKAQSMTLAEIFAAVKGSRKGFLVHVYVKRYQSHTFQEKKKRVDGHHIVMQVNFAQNMEIKLQNEVQSAHWRHKAVTLFTLPNS